MTQDFRMDSLVLFDKIQSEPSDVHAAEDKYQELVKEAQDRNVSWQSYIFTVMKSWYGSNFRTAKRFHNPMIPSSSLILGDLQTDKFQSCGCACWVSSPETL